MPGRREFLKTTGLGLLAAGIPGLSFARAETESRFVLVILRGAADGLAMLAPYGDPRYRRLRGELALPPPGEENGLIKLDGLFGLHPAFANVHDMYTQGHALLLHAVASPYRERSHFDAQNLLENGTQKPGGARDGWLNRALAHMHSDGGGQPAIAMAQNVPLVLRGAEEVTSWAPSVLSNASEATIDRIHRLYAKDEFFATRLQQALDSRDIAGDLSTAQRRRNRQKRAREMIQAAAKFLRAPNGPRIAVIESGGWDTHANQGGINGNLAGRFADLDASLGEFRDAMGADWSRTVISVVTEFGRTVKVNGTRGTDHGTAGAVLLLGGAVNGGRVVTDWPGLKDADLYESRDLAPTTDLTSVFKGILQEHLQVSQGALDKEVFPDSANAAVLEDLIRT